MGDVMPDLSVKTASPPIWRYGMTALVAGLAAAAIEMLFVLPIQVILGNGPAVVFKSIAAGLLGKAALQGGVGALALGVGIHVFVSVVAAAIYVFAARAWDDVLIRKPVISGMAFGAVCYVVMTFIVVPLSALGYRPNPFIDRIWMSIAIHIFAFGLPIGVLSRLLLARSVASPAGTSAAS